MVPRPARAATPREDTVGSNATEARSAVLVRPDRAERGLGRRSGDRREPTDFRWSRRPERREGFRGPYFKLLLATTNRSIHSLY